MEIPSIIPKITGWFFALSVMLIFTRRLHPIPIIRVGKFRFSLSPGLERRYLKGQDIDVKVVGKR
jgi:hypothetical protein